MTTDLLPAPEIRAPSPAPRSRWLPILRSRRVVGLVLLVPALAAFAFLFVYPMIGVIEDSITLPTTGTENYREMFNDGYTLRILVRTLWVALLVAIIDVVLAFPFAYMMTTCSPRMRAVLMIVVLIPFWGNATAKNFGLMVLFQNEGLVHKFTSLFGWDQPLIGTMPGVIIAMAQVMLPFAVLPLYASLGQINLRLVDAAQGLGATRVKAFWRIYIPLAMPGIGAALALVFLLSLGFYITPAMIGSPQQTLIAQLIMARVGVIFDFGGAAAIGVFLLAVTLVVLAMTQVVGGRLTRGRKHAPMLEAAATQQGRHR